MAEKQIIPNAYDLAVKVAETILNKSYHGVFNSQPSINDVLLFGSTMREEPAHDLDLLVLHKFHPLASYGVVTKYDEKTHSLIVNPDGNIQKGAPSESILHSMGGKDIYDLFDLEEEIDSIFHRNLASIRGTINSIEEKNYHGKLDLEFGSIEFPEPVSFMEVLDARTKFIEEEIRSKTVLYKVKALVQERGLDLGTVLDLHAMDVDLLYTQKMQDEREMAIQQCTDPTFWNTVLTTGKLYNSESGKFDIPVDQKYEGATSLFPN
jgi:predicted nucleotidyltransferase